MYVCTTLLWFLLEGTDVPSFYKYFFMQENTVKKLVDRSLQNHPDLFLIDLQFKPNNQIIVVLDGDAPVSVKDCTEVNREIESQLDRESEDFSLKVTSTGLSSPLKMPRQFKKNLGRKLKVKTTDNKYKAKLTKADDEGIELKWKQREPKPVGKGKHTVQKQVELDYNAIKEAKVQIIFNK